MSRKQKITLDMLGAELGLTKHTVSKALRGLSGMSEDTRQAVVDLAARWGYLTKEQKKGSGGIRQPQPADGCVYRLLFVVVSDSAGKNPTHQLLFQGVYERANELGHSAIMIFLPASIETAAQFEQWADQNKLAEADGLFITPNTPEFLEQQLLGMGMPRVLLNFPPPNARADSVIWDVYYATQAAVHDLADKGHRRIMYIGEVHDARGSSLRWQSFCHAMQELGLETDSQIHLLEGDQELDKLSEHFLERYRNFHPTALISTGYNDLKWIYYATGTLGLQIPEDCSLVTLSTAPLTTDVARPIFLVKESGARSVDQMVRRIGFPAAPYERVTLTSYYHEGSTVSKISAEVASR